jgi:hypothetical protein
VEACLRSPGVSRLWGRLAPQAHMPFCSARSSFRAPAPAPAPSSILMTILMQPPLIPLRCALSGFLLRSRSWKRCSDCCPNGNRHACSPQHLEPAGSSQYPPLSSVCDLHFILVQLFKIRLQAAAGGDEQHDGRNQRARLLTPAIRDRRIKQDRLLSQVAVATPSWVYDCAIGQSMYVQLSGSFCTVPIICYL